MKRVGSRKLPVVLPLFNWRVAVVNPQSPSRTTAGFLARRYRLQPHMAETVAYLAGLGDREAQK